MRLGPIEFYTPPLVEGPRVMFYIPVPHKFSFAMDLGNGHYALPVTITVVTTWVIMALFYLLFHFGVKKLEKNPSKVQTFYEIYHGALDGFVGGALGKHKEKYLAYIGALVSFVFISNIFCVIPTPGFRVEEGVMHIFPMFRTPTADLNTTVGLALITTVTFLIAAFKTNGVLGYFKHMMEPAPIMFPIHLLGEFAKPTNISMRLFGNMFAGMVIMGLIYSVVPWVIPVPMHLYFDLFIGLVQAYVFTMLTMVYIQQQLGDGEHAGGAH